MATFSELIEEARRRVRRLGARKTGDSAKPLIEDVMLAIGRLGVAIEQDPALRDRPEFTTLVDELQPAVRNASVYLSSYPSDIVLDYARVWEGGELEQASWLRSALQFFVELIRGTPAEDELPDLKESLDDLDEHLRRWDEREGGAPPAEPGIPRSHWWWSFPEASPASPAHGA
jgi:hypothetical protein